jgi:putative molybdopterin biosynthesis protein
MAGPLLTTNDVAALLRVHPKHVYRLLRKGLPGRRVGSEWRFERDEVLAWAGARAAPAAAPPEAPGPGPAPPPPLVAANGDVAVEILLRLSRARGPPLLGLVQADMTEGIDLLRRAAVLATGAHAGAFPSHVGEERVARIHLVTREVGLVSRRDREPPPLEALGALRLASRPTTAGVRRHLDALLAAAGIDPALVHRGALLLGSHADVAAAVASGRADAGLASRAWGERLGLSFRPLASEAYGLILRARDLGDPRAVRLCEVAQSAAYRGEASAAGYDVAGAGDVRYDA